ncbi:hypothetical protein B4Q13_24435, partial [Lacticaseibacillus rhamnosus]
MQPEPSYDSTKLFNFITGYAQPVALEKLAYSPVTLKPELIRMIGEEIANAITHGIGAALSIAALVLLVVRAAIHGDAWRVVSLSIYGSTLIFLYLSSTLYH